MKVGIVAQRDNARAATLASDVAAELTDGTVSVVVDEATAAALAGTAVAPPGVPIEEMATCELVVSIGGDGTFLYAARGAGTTPIVGVNLGEVGFLNAVAPEDAVGAVAREVEALREGESVRTRTMDRLAATAGDRTVPAAVNEVAILGPQRGHGNGAHLTVTVDGDPYSVGHADGVLVATPTGSTAYNLSEGGPLVHPAVTGIVVTEMGGDAGMPPLVVDGGAVVNVRVENASRAHVVSDGRVGEAVTPPETVRVERANEPVNVAGPALDFFAGLEKLE